MAFPMSAALQTTKSCLSVEDAAASQHRFDMLLLVDRQTYLASELSLNSSALQKST